MSTDKHAPTLPVSRILRIVLLACIVVGLVSVAYGSYRLIFPVKATNTKLTAPSSKVYTYTSTQDKFVVAFPGIPTVTHSNIPADGDQILQNTYEKDMVNVQTYYYVTVTNYPASYTFSDVRDALQQAANGEVRNMQGAKMNSDMFTPYLGENALDTVYTVPSNGTTHLVASRNVLKGNTIYTILVIGGTQATFMNFANSFHFTK